MPASQVNGIVEDINELSPVLADIYGVLKRSQIVLINDPPALVGLIQWAVDAGHP